MRRKCTTNAPTRQTVILMAAIAGIFCAVLCSAFKTNCLTTTIVAAEELTPSSAPAATSNPAQPVTLGKGRTNAMFIDDDGDGYGVASPLGPDADDSDPAVNTTAQALAKYGTVKDLLKHLGYQVKHIYYLSPTANDRGGLMDDMSKPYGTFAKVHRLVHPGDAVVYLQGTYKENIDVEWPSLKGTPKQPIIIMAMPGQKVTIDNAYGGIVVGEGSRDLVFDGFVIDNSDPDHYGRGVWGNDYSNVTFKNIESIHHSTGIESMQDLHDVSIEGCVIHDNPHTHGIYLGARDKPNSNITIKGNLVYRNGYHGIQHNGRVTNMVIEDNIIHSNSLGGISLLDGVSGSTIRGNLIFNNNRSGIIFYNYDEDPQARIGTKPFDMNDNLIEKNIIWIGATSPDGTGDPSEQASVLFSDDTAAQACSMRGNVIRKNVMVTQQGQAMKFADERFALSTKIEDNVIHRADGHGQIMSVGHLGKRYVDYEWAAFVNYSSLVGPNTFEDPRFADVKVDYAAMPDRFDFRRLAEKIGDKP